MLAAFAALGVLVSCQTENLDAPQDESATRIEIPTPEPRFVDLGMSLNNDKVTVTTSRGEQYGTALFMAEYITADGAEEMGNTVFFSDRGNKQLSGDFVPELQLLFNGTTNMSTYVDENRETADVPAGASSAAIRSAMATWDNVTCSDLGLFEIPYDGRATGFVSALLGFGGSFNYVADVTHCGWLGGPFFDNLAPGGSNFILGVAFTIIFTDGAGNPVDVDNNGKIDVAWREIYYNDAFGWNTGSTFDIETVALHEAGHGLSQAHFGKAFVSNGNGKVHFSPRAVMNASYSGVQTSIAKSDNGGHCSNWGQWPNN